MYTRYAETQGWKIEILTSSESATGGYKEAIALIAGKDVYSQLRFEGGVHRVQRVPATETQGADPHLDGDRRRPPRGRGRGGAARRQGSRDQ